MAHSHHRFVFTIVSFTKCIHVKEGNNSEFSNDKQFRILIIKSTPSAFFKVWTCNLTPSQQNSVNVFSWRTKLHKMKTSKL